MLHRTTIDLSLLLNTSILIKSDMSKDFVVFSKQNSNTIIVKAVYHLLRYNVQLALYEYMVFFL